jgi:hypothetical protein
MGKHTLLMDYDYDFELIGISCHLKDYRFCWLLNRLLEQNLEKQERGIQTDLGVFSTYASTCPETETKFSLIVNRSSKGFFSAEHRQADYLLVLHNNCLMEAEEIIDLLNGDSNVIMAYSINVEGLKSKEYLLSNDI